MLVHNHADAYAYFQNTTTRMRPDTDSFLISGHSVAGDELPNIWLELPWSDKPTIEYNGWCTNHLGHVYSARVVVIDEMKANILVWRSDAIVSNVG